MDLETLNDCLAMITEARDELAADPSLASSEDWREHTEEKGYRVYTLLSTEDD